MARGGIENLRVPTSEQAREFGRRGGLATQRNNRERKKTREIIQMILDLEVKGKNNKKFLDDLGIEAGDQHNRVLLLSRMFVKAAMTGDASSVRAILDMGGELEVMQQEQKTPEINITVLPATADDIDEND